MRATLIALLLAFSPWTAFLALADEKPPPPKTDLGFDASKVPPHDPKKGQPLARVLDQYVYSDEPILKANVSERDKLFALRCCILGPLFDRFKQREQITATAEEIAELESFLKKRKLDRAPGLTHLFWYRLYTAKESADQHGLIPIDAIVEWKIERELFKRYGGVVTVSKFRSPMPIDAYRRFLEDAERTGAFEIFDKELRNALFEQLSHKPRFTVPPDEVNFDTPWWLQAKNQKPN